MAPKQVEEKLTELVHRSPFVPFVVELNDGRVLTVETGGVAFDDAGAVYFGSDGGLVDFVFTTVRTIRLMKTEAVA